VNLEKPTVDLFWGGSFTEIVDGFLRWLERICGIEMKTVAGYAGAILHFIMYLMWAVGEFPEMTVEPSSIPGELYVAVGLVTECAVSVSATAVTGSASSDTTDETAASVHALKSLSKVKRMLESAVRQHNHTGRQESVVKAMEAAGAVAIAKAKAKTKSKPNTDSGRNRRRDTVDVGLTLEADPKLLHTAMTKAKRATRKLAGIRLACAWRDYTLLTVLRYDTASRVDELRKLHVKHLVWLDGRYTVVPNVVGDTNKFPRRKRGGFARTLPDPVRHKTSKYFPVLRRLSLPSSTVLRQYLTVHRPRLVKADEGFVWEDGTAFSPGAYRRWMGEVYQRFVGTKFAPRQVRKAFSVFESGIRHDPRVAMLLHTGAALTASAAFAMRHSRGMHVSRHYSGVGGGGGGGLMQKLWEEAHREDPVGWVVGEMGVGESRAAGKVVESEDGGKRKRGVKRKRVEVEVAHPVKKLKEPEIELETFEAPLPLKRGCVVRVPYEGVKEQWWYGVVRDFRTKERENDVAELYVLEEVCVCGKVKLRMLKEAQGRDVYPVFVEQAEVVRVGKRGVMRASGKEWVSFVVA